MAKMNTWLQACDDARQAMRRVAKMLLDQQSHELFEICNAMSGMGAEADDQDSGAVACGLYAACYRVAGSEKVIANAVMQTLTSVDKLAVSGLGIKKKMINHQSAIKEFAMALQEDCCNELMHLTSEIDVILEHPFCAVDGCVAGNKMLYSMVLLLI